MVFLNTESQTIRICFSDVFLNNCLLILSLAKSLIHVTERRGVKNTFEPCHEKTNVLVSDLVRHKPGCTATEDGWRLEISDLESRGIVLSM